MLVSTTQALRVALPVLAFLAWTPVARAWSWPVHGAVLQPFVYDEAHPYAAGQHRGIDIGADAAGDTVVAPAAGTVTFAGTVPSSGQSVTIETPDGYSVTLTHLGSIVAAKGATVAEEDAVGTVGPSGTPEVDGQYVHLGIRLTADPNGYVDPLGLLPAPPAESPPQEDDSTASQPSAGGGVSAPAPATEPAPAATSTPPASTPAASTPAASTPAASTPAARTPRSTVQSRPHGTSRRGRGNARTSRPEARRPRSAQRPAVPVPSAVAPATPLRAAKPKPKRRLSESPSSVHQPVLEAAVFAEPTHLDAGRKPRPHADVGRPAQPQRQSQTSGELLALVCNGAAALVALAAALAARRRLRRGADASPVAGGQVVHLPPRELDRRRRHAA